MIKLVVVLAVLFGIVAMAYDMNSDGPARANDSRIETGWKDLDSILDDGLSPGTHHAIAGGLSDSAGLLRGWGDGVVGKVQEAATP